MTDIVPEIEKRRDRWLESLNKSYNRSQPVASDLEPDSCLRRQVLEIVAPERKEPITPQLRALFEAGNNLESQAVSLLFKLEIQVARQQEPYQFRHQKTGVKSVGGRRDGVLFGTHELEIKLVSPWMFDSLTSAESFRDHHWTKKYLAQINIGMLASGLENGLFMLGDARGRWRWVEVALDLELAERSLRHAEAIVDAAEVYRQGEPKGLKSLPDFTSELSQCARCPFLNRACFPPAIVNPGANVDSTEEDEDKLSRWYKLKDTAREFDALDRWRKDRFSEGQVSIVGSFVVERTERFRKGYVVQDSTYSVIKVSKIGEDKE